MNEVLGGRRLVTGGGLRRISRAAFERWERFAASPSATALIAIWAFAEATVWPIIPDFLLAPIVAGNRRRFHVPLAAAIAGSALGGIVLLLFAYSAPGRAEDLLVHLPMVSDRQIQIAASRLNELGAAGFLVQPWSGVPFKVWGVQAAVQRLDPWLVVPSFIAGRGIRMALVAAACRLVVGRFRGFLADFSLFVAATYLVAFSIGLWLVLR